MPRCTKQVPPPGAPTDSTATPLQPEPPWSIAKTCTHLGVCRKTLEGMIKDGGLKTILVGARRLVPASEVRRLSGE